MHSFQLIDSSDIILSFEQLIQYCSDQKINIEAKNKLIRDFTSANKHNYPFIKDQDVYFIFYGNAKLVHVVGDFNGWDSFDDTSQMTKVANTNLFYLKKSFSSDARIDYRFIVDTESILDPLNEHHVMGGFGYNSELQMPKHSVSKIDFSNQPETERGTIKKILFQSKIQNNWTRRIYIYLPPGYNQEQNNKYPSFYAVDGTDYLFAGNVKEILDQSIHQKIFPKIIGIFIDPLTPSLRIRDFNGNNCQEDSDELNFEGKTNICREKYCEFLIKELIPFIDSNFNTITDDPTKRAHVGVSLGGILSTYIALNYSDFFKLIGSQSGSFWIDPAVYITFAVKQIVDMKFYLNAGMFEKRNYNHTKEFAKILKKEQYQVKEEYYNQGHSWGFWKETFGQMLEFLFNS